LKKKKDIVRVSRKTVVAVVFVIVIVDMKTDQLKMPQLGIYLYPKTQT
jgi:hypothetical protein